VREALAATAADAVSGDTVRGFQNHPKTASCASSPIAACFKRFRCVGRVAARPTLEQILEQTLEQWQRKMINNHFPTVFTVLSVLAALAAPANAAESAAQAHIPERPVH
jgi:hypothetical protein